MSQPVLSSLLANAAKVSVAAFFEAWCWIQEKGGAFREGAPLHLDQRKTVEVIEWCKTNKKPCRLIKLKPRRGGSSTISVAALHHEESHEVKRGCIMAGNEFQGNSLFAMLRLMASRDRTVSKRANVLDALARYPNGSIVDRINGSNPNAGLAAGYEIMIITELAKWASQGVAAADQVLNGALKCVPYLPGTMIIIESTADGVGNEYHRRYQEAITFDELKAGKEGYVKIFTPWFEFPDYVKDPKTEGIGSFDDLSKDERDLSARYGLDLDRIAWMRHCVRTDCGGDFDDFKENYPFNDVECFLLTGRKAFSTKGLEKMKSDAVKFPVSIGNLDIPLGIRHDAQVAVWSAATPQDCRVLRWEQPKEGMKYLISVDSMTGASQTVGADPDSHFVTVWRAGYFERGTWNAPRVVAHLVDDYELWLRQRKYILQWDIDVLEEQIWRLALYFGNCMIVPEMNKDRGIVELLKLRPGANIYVRTQFNRREQTETNAYGWVTTGENRGRLVTLMQQGIREYANIDPIKGWSQDRCEIYSPIILDECETFVVKSDGRCEAMSGRHDDSVLSCGIGLACIDSATTYHKPAGVPMIDPFADESRQPVLNTYS